MIRTQCLLGRQRINLRKAFHMGEIVKKGYSGIGEDSELRKRRLMVTLSIEGA